MSILQQPENLRKQHTAGGAAVWLVAYLGVVFFVGAMLGAWLVRMGMEAEGGFWSDLVESQRGSRIVRRVQTVLAVLLGPLMLKQIGWKGFSDLGWDAARKPGAGWKDVGRGFLFGFGVIGLIFVVSLVFGLRAWEPFSVGGWTATILYSFLVTGLGVGVIEETLARGVLYRSMARPWGAWGGAVVSSGIFAYVHFLKASAESFEKGVFAPMLSQFMHGFAEDAHSGLKMVNLFLFGLLLCRFVHRRGDIWYAVGIHGAAVGLIRVVSNLSDRVGDRSPWIGHSAKFDDGWLLTVLLGMALVVCEWVRSPSEDPNRVSF